MAKQSKVTVSDTIAKSFLMGVAARQDRPAMREKDFGVWRKISWNDWLAKSRDVTYGLHALGFRPGDVASIVGNTNPEWCYSDMGVLCGGGISSGIYPTDSAKQVEYLLNDSGTKVVFVEDDEQLDKVLECRARCPKLERIVIFDMEGLAAFNDPMAVSLDALTKLGRGHQAGREALFQELVDTRTSEDVAILVYTSGTTGPPKGAMLTNKNVTAQMKHAETLFPLEKREERLLFLPLCHVAERIGGYYFSVASGSIMNFAESPETVPDNIREVQPSAFLAVPRIWEKFYSSTMIALKDATPMESGPTPKPSASAAAWRTLAWKATRPPSRSACKIRQPTGWCCATSAKCSASIAPRASSPAQHPSHLISCAGTCASASTCTRSTARPKIAASPPR
jgi:long-chain acyl-CoA synthetase